MYCKLTLNVKTKILQQHYPLNNYKDVLQINFECKDKYLTTTLST